MNALNALARTALHHLCSAGLRHSARAFERAAQDPERAQHERLQRFLADNAGSVYGLQYGYHSIRTVEEFQRRVPVVDHAHLAPRIEQAAAGHTNVLSTSPLRMFERTSGSTSATRLVPYTDDLLQDISHATGPWFHHLLSSVDGLVGSPQYWSISPVAQQRQRTEGGIPIGFTDDAQFLSGLENLAARFTMAVPASVAALPSVEEWRLSTLRHLLEAHDLGLISVWSPSYLTLLMQAAREHLPSLLKLLRPSRAAEILDGLDAEGALVGEAFWPGLRLISCWTDGVSAQFVPELRRFFPKTPIQGKGLLATEGVVSVPLSLQEDAGRVLAVRSHFMEFMDLDAPRSRPLLAHALREGGRYSPVLTTGNGFARFHLKDVVTVTGMQGRTPCIRFEGRLDGTTDLCGEKVAMNQVEDALKDAQRSTGVRASFSLMTPLREPSAHYRLYVECDGAAAAVTLRDAVEEQLMKAHPYRYCRELGQLAPLEVVRVRDGWRQYQQALAANGIRLGDAKAQHLDARPIWRDAFTVEARP